MIWDTAGQEKYRSLAPMYYRGARCAIVAYDITKAVSFDCLQSWVDELRRNGPEDILVALVGNKCDLQDRRAVEQHTAEATAEEIGAVYYETSAATGKNVEEVFAALARAVMEEDLELEREQAAMEGQAGGGPGGSGAGPGPTAGPGGDDGYGGRDGASRQDAARDRVDLSKGGDGAGSGGSGGGGCAC